MATEIIRLKSSESGHTYTTTINRKNRAAKGLPNKIEMNKFDPTRGVRKVVRYKEIKLK